MRIPLGRTTVLLLAGLIILVGAGAAIWVPACYLFHPLEGGGFIWIPEWLPVWVLPAAAVALGIACLATRRTGLHRALGATLLLDLAMQICLLWPGLRRLDTLNRQPESYVSQREYLPLGGKGRDWADPGRPSLFDLGRGVRLVMTTTVAADAERRTLPIAPGKGPSVFSSAEPARPLSRTGLDNLSALARAIGYLRYFHPTDQAAEADWDRLARDGMLQVEGASSPENLAERLTAVFLVVAPSVQFLAPGQAFVALATQPGTAYWVRWRHRGLGTMPVSGQPWLFWEDRGTRLACVAQVWSAMQHFHPFLGEFGGDWQAELKKALAAAAVAEAGTFQVTLRRLMAALGDGHAEVYPNWDERRVPPVRLRLIHGRVWVGPAETTLPALPVGSEILTIDHVPVAAQLRRREQELSASSEGWMRAKLAFRLLSGPAGSSVKVGFRTRGGQHGHAVLCRSEEQSPYPAAPVQVWPPGISYLDLGRMSADEFIQREPDLRAAKVIIADLRNHLRSSRDAEKLLSRLASRPMICPRWTIAEILLPDRHGWRWVCEGRWLVLPKGRRLPGKVVFLVDGGVISAGETFLSFVETYGLGEILGEPSAGCNGNVNRNPIIPGGSVIWTGMRVLKQDGSRHLGLGIQPTISVSPTCQGIMQGRDEILEKAVAWAMQHAG